jgi:hypothetical protein
MYGHKAHSGMPRLTNYQEALTSFNNIKPIAGNGKNAGIKPLGKRDKPENQILMRHDGSIACRLYSTNVVVFNKDDTINIDPAGYSTMTTAKFISEVLGVTASQFDSRLIVSINRRSFKADGLKLRHVGYDYEVVEAKQFVTYRIDRKAISVIRKDVQKFRKFVTNLMNIKDYTLTEEELHEIQIVKNGRLTLDMWRSDGSQQIAMFNRFMAMVKSGDSENQFSAAMWLCASARYTPWDKRYDPKSVLKLFDDILIALNPNVLLMKPLEFGTIRVDSYKRFKPFTGLKENT